MVLPPRRSITVLGAGFLGVEELDRLAGQLGALPRDLLAIVPLDLHTS
jgi:hypothetical protein